MSEERKVRARHGGHYDGHRRAGEVFTIKSEAAFAASWMEPVGWTPPAAPTPASQTIPAGPSAEEHTKALARIAELDGLLQAERAEHAKTADRATRLAAELAAEKAKGKAVDPPAGQAAAPKPVQPITPAPSAVPVKKT